MREKEWKRRDDNIYGRAVKGKQHSWNHFTMLSDRAREVAPVLWVFYSLQGEKLKLLNKQALTVCSQCFAGQWGFLLITALPESLHLGWFLD